MPAGRRSKTSWMASAMRSSGTGSGPEGLDVQAHGASAADGVGHLNLATLASAGGDDVLGDPAHGVGGGAVHLRGVLAGESTAAVTGHAAVGVDDDLAAGQAGIPGRTNR